MKLGSPFFILLIIAFAFLSISMIIEDFATNYPEAGNVSTGFKNRYNNLNFVNSSISGISKNLENLGEASLGWKVFVAIVVVPIAVITTIFNLILAIPILGGIIMGISKELGVPPLIIDFAVVALFVSIIIMLIKFKEKSAPV